MDNFDQELLEQAKSFAAATPVAEPIPQPAIEETIEQSESQEPETEIPAEENAPVSESEENAPVAEKAWYDEDEPSAATDDEYHAQLKEYGVEKLSAQEVLAKFKELEAKKAPVDPVDEHPSVQALKNLLKEGKSVQEFVSLIGTEDPAKLSPEELFNLALDKHNLTEEQKEIELERFESKTYLEKLQITKPIAEDLQRERNGKLEQFNSNFKQTEANRQQVIERAIQETKDLVSGYVGKEFDGYPVTQQVADSITNYMMTQAPHVYKADGTLDVQRMFKIGMYEKFNAAIVRHNISKTKVEAKKSVLNDINNPDKSNTVRTTHNPRKETAAERGQALLDWEIQQRGGI